VCDKQQREREGDETQLLSAVGRSKNSKVGRVTAACKKRVKARRKEKTNNSSKEEDGD